MSEELTEHVWKTRASTYHKNRECKKLNNGKVSVKKISLETAEAWELSPCAACVIEEQDKAGYNKWNEFVNECRDKG